MKINEAAKPLLVMLIAILAAGVGTAAAISYFLGTSAPATVTITEASQTIIPTITPSQTTGAEGTQIILTAQASANWANKPVSFYDGATLIQTVNTDATGMASITVTPAIGVHSYTVGP